MRTRKEGGEAVLLESLLDGDPSGAIENQEVRGQSSFCNSTDLPVSYGIYRDVGSKDAVLTSWGIKLGEPYENDPIFRPAELPAGWKKEPTDHSMWNHLVDDKGRVRAKIFYKAAFYDRASHMHLQTRFSVVENYDDFYDNEKHELTKIQCRVFEGGKPLFSVEPVDVPFLEDGRQDFVESKSIQESQVAQCEAWLNVDHPDWEDPAKYWDDE